MNVPKQLRLRLTDDLLGDVPGLCHAVVSAAEPGIVAGLDALSELVAEGQFGRFSAMQGNGDDVAAHTPIAQFTGTATQLAAAEDTVLGPLGYAGGIARRCRQIRASAPPGLRLVCGGWKKLPAPLKPLLREGLAVGGIAPRLVDDDFVYLDKNVVILSGGVKPAVSTARRLCGGRVAVQVTTVDEAITAVHAGAAIVMDDTGDVASLQRIDQALRERGMRERITLAFAGGVRADDLRLARRHGAEVVDLGRAILDAPLWDVRMVVTP